MTTSTKKHQKTKLQEHWLQDPVLKLCTEKVENDKYKSRCTDCKKEVRAEKSLEHFTKNSHSSNISREDRGNRRR